MDIRHKKKIQANFVSIGETLRVEDVVDYLHQDNILSSEQMEEVNCKLLGITHYEAARRLIRILYTKVNGYARFVYALNEGGYDFLAQQIDSSNGEGITEGDLAWASKGYLHDFHDNLQQQTEMMTKFMKDMADVKRSQNLLLNQNQPLSSTPDSLGGVRESMEKHGLTQDEVIRYLEFRMTQPDVVDGPVNISSPTSISLEFALASYTQSLTALLIVDIIYYSTSTAKKQQIPTAPNIYAKTLRKSVYDVINNKYKEEFLRSVTLLQIRNAHCYTTMTKVLDEIIDGGEMNWGRVVVVYAFCSWLAQQIAVMGDDDVAKSIGGFLAFHITRSTNFCDWIDKNGGFDMMVTLFGQRSVSWEYLLGIAMLGVSLGVLLARK